MGSRIPVGLMPSALSATISPAADIRPNTLVTANKTVAGTANNRALGRMYGMSRTIGPMPSPCSNASLPMPNSSKSTVSAVTTSTNTCKTSLRT